MPPPHVRRIFYRSPASIHPGKYTPEIPPRPHIYIVLCRRHKSETMLNPHAHGTTLFSLTCPSCSLFYSVWTKWWGFLPYTPRESEEAISTGALVQPLSWSSYIINGEFIGIPSPTVYARATVIVPSSLTVTFTSSPLKAPSTPTGKRIKESLPCTA